MAAVKEEVKKSPESYLENRKVIVQPIDTIDKGFFKVGHDGNHTFTGCWKLYQLPVSISTRCYVNPFETKDEQEAFEIMLGLEKGELNPNKKDSKFWSEFKVRLDKNPKELDLSNVMDALEYKVLSVDPKFAKDGVDIHSGQFEYKLVDERYKEEESTKFAVKKDEAWEEYFKIKKNPQKLLDVLRLLGIKLSETADLKVLQAKVVEVIERSNKAKDPLLKNIDDFLSVVNDPKATIKLFLYDAMDAGEVKVKNGTDYTLGETGELIAKSFMGAVDWFLHIDNKEIKQLIEQRLRNS